MGLTLIYEEGQTPLDEEEKDGLLIPTITTRGELDEFEQLNIQKAIEWSLKRKWPPGKIFTEDFIKQLHYKMFGDVWRWAGKFRLTNKNIGVNSYKIGIELKHLLDDALYWVAHQTYPPHEIAIRFKHRIVSIHCFPNGNGRHSRLIADIIIEHVFKNDVYSWGSFQPREATEIRKAYIIALKKADRGDIGELIAFSKS